MGLRKRPDGYRAGHAVLCLPRFLLALWLAVQAAPAAAEAFDYYTLAVTLTPAFCDQNPKLRNSLQCRERMPFSVHGLWPEKKEGRAPESCAGGALTLSPRTEKYLRSVMPDTSLRQHEWKKHGRCSGLDAERYFALLEKEFVELKWPAQLQPGRDTIVERDVVLREFRRLNPGVPERGVMLRCEKKGRPPLLAEIRVCLTPDGRPTECIANFRPNCPVAVKVRAR
ncbi:MAG: ribonuclease [Moraxellaceae bacterium]|jgi:ribonuclease T2|nr:ribonuclease [Moraxellaceae bacterium]